MGFWADFRRARRNQVFAENLVSGLCCTEARLESYGLNPFISLWVSSVEIGLEKPDLAIFQGALKQAQCAPHQALMIGDRVDNDIRPAKLAESSHA